tara:strand:- start:18217 stop:19212 length:996 start_codon:yes stop_codon:yes gene_type:complete
MNNNNVVIIAEACDNHLGNLETAKEMAFQSKKAGADIVKFQHHIPDEEMLKDSPMSDNFDEPLYDFLVKYALNLDQHIQLIEFCKKIEIEYLCTPFSLAAAIELKNLGIKKFKIGSGEMTDTPTISNIADFSDEMIISTGMSTFDEIDKTYNLLISKKINFSLLNCTSEYPPIYEDINLGVIPQMIKRYPNAKIGHSDHTNEIYTSIAAVSLGAKIIEKHIILDKNQKGPDQEVSIDMKQLNELVYSIRNIEKSLGKIKKINDKEKPIRKWAFRSIVSKINISKGEIIKQNMIWSKRPGTGIPSNKMNEVINKKAKKDIPNNVIIKWEDLE